ncbi:hypothetical protein BCR42DRAFT_234567 [Absidia repens]|uniref:Uncharacterized protein n=1 Tax=Absidia repens TaxID=90262 RepID=A0A1X2IM98_9FUNG|nr:hypothetical protein BCR42DRAFT_234567 [Absidia repens]
MVDGYQQKGESALSKTGQRRGLGDKFVTKNNDEQQQQQQQPSSVKTLATITTDETAGIANANIPSATHDDFESTAQPNGTITPDGEQPEQEATSTLDHAATKPADLEDKATVLEEKEEASVDKPTTTTETPSAATTMADDTKTTQHPLPDSTSASISSTVDDVVPETITTNTTTTTTTATTTASSSSTSTTTNVGDQEEVTSGWGAAPSFSSPATASSAWTQGILPEKQHEEAEKPAPTPAAAAEGEETAASWAKVADDTGSGEDSSNGWGSPATGDHSPPVWEGKLPDDLVTPGDETISGDVSESKWQPISDYEQRRMMGGGRGGSSSGGRGYRGGGGGPGSGFGQGRGGGGYRSYGDGGSGRGGGMRRGPGGPGSGTGWNKARSPRPE